MLNTLVLGSPQDMRYSHLHHPRVMTDGSETHPLTNLEQHGQRGYRVTRNFTEGEGGNMPVGTEGKWGRGRGDDQGATRIRTTASGDPENLKRQQQTGPFYGPRRLWQRAEFWGRGRASGRRHRVTRIQAQEAQLPGSGTAPPQLESQQRGRAA